jgi:hypothetical protein
MKGANKRKSAPAAGQRNGAAGLIAKLGLREHPEGGFYREMFRSALRVDAAGVERSAVTCIYYLLTRGTFSAFHRLRFDELWHFLGGSLLRIHCLRDGGEPWALELGPGRELQAVVPAGTWFAAEVIEGEFALLGCTVAPGFEFADFELADRGRLAAEFPGHEHLIRRLTR